MWAETLGSGETLDLPRHLQRPDRLRRFEKYIAEAKALSDEECPHKIKVPRRKKDAAFEKEVDKIIQKRDQASSVLDIDPSLVIARSVAESIAAGEVSPSDVLLPWQREQLQIEG